MSVRPTAQSDLRYKMPYDGQCRRDRAQNESQRQQLRCKLSLRVHCQLAIEPPTRRTVNQFYPADDGGEQEDYR